MHTPHASIIEGDCLETLKAFDDASFDMVYLDPPFNTGRTMKADGGAYHDSWDNIHDYLRFMRPRLEQLHRILKNTGSIMLHCDWRTCHHFRFVLDEIFGESHFVNHLIWAYGLGGSSPRRFSRKHDDILFYGKSASYYFQPPQVPATSHRMKGQFKKATDVLDIPTLNNMALERVGYPTQKPLALLELLITAACPPAGHVLDPFCGSGTTMIAALTLGRNATTIDANPEAIAIATKRLHDFQTKQKSQSA